MAKLLFGGPTLAALSGERRQAFVRQRIISACILVVGIMFVLAVQFTGGNTSTALRAILLLVALQVIYAFVRKETLWQLRVRELRHRSDERNASKAELLTYADQLQRGQK